MNELKQQSLDTFKTMYFHELSTKEAIHARVSVPLTTLSIVVTLLIYSLSEAKNLSDVSLRSILVCTFYFGVISEVFLVSCSAYLLLSVSWGQKYHFPPKPPEIADYVKSIDSSSDDEQKKAEMFADYLVDLYCNSADTNQQSNFKKMTQIRRGNLLIIFALLICIANSLLLYILK